MKPLSEVSLKSLAHAQFTIDGAPWYDLSSLPWLPYMRQLWLYLQSIATANNYMPKNHLNWSLQLTKPLPPAIPLESLRQLVCSASQAINQDPVAKQCWEQLTTLHVFELDLNWNNRCLLLIHQEMASLLRVLCLRYCELRDDDLSMLNQLDQLEQMDLLGNDQLTVRGWTNLCRPINYSGTRGLIRLREIQLTASSVLSANSCVDALNNLPALWQITVQCPVRFLADEIKEDQDELGLVNNAFRSIRKRLSAWHAVGRQLSCSCRLSEWDSRKAPAELYTFSHLRSIVLRFVDCRGRPAVEQIEKRLKYSNSRDYLNDDSIDDDNSDNYHRDKQRLAIPVELKFTRTDGTNGIANSAAAPKRPKLLQIKQQSQANKQLQFFNQLLLLNTKTQIDSTI